MSREPHVLRSVYANERYWESIIFSSKLTFEPGPFIFYPLSNPLAAQVILQAWEDLRTGDGGKRELSTAALSQFSPALELPREAQVGKSPIQTLLSLFLEPLKFFETLIFDLHYLKSM